MVCIAFEANKNKLASMDAGFTPMAKDFVAMQVNGIKANPASPMDPGSRAALVRGLCGALLEVASNWRAFGYGNKSDFASDADAERSFRAAWADFKGRCQGAGEADGDMCVAVLVLCTRGAVLGTSRLDDPQQARAVLQHRMGIAPEAMLAADCFLAPANGALSHGEAFHRFPEMQPLGPG